MISVKNVLIVLAVAFTAYLAARGLWWTASVPQPLVVVISRSMAERFWPGGDPIGRRIRRGAVPEWLTIVGVVDDTRDLGLNVPPADTIYTPVYQGSSTAIRRPGASPAAFARRRKRR